MEMQTILESLVTIAKLNNIIYTEGASLIDKPWVLREGADKEQIELFESKGYQLPHELYQFLLFTNGIECGSSEQQIYDISTLIEQEKVNHSEFRPGIYNFAYFFGDRLFIDSSLIDSGNYIFYEGSGFNNGNLLGCDFITFFERLIICNFHNYWRWLDYPQKIIPYLNDCFYK